MLPLCFSFIFIIPMGKAFLVGIASARDPGHRVTLLDAWFFFDRGARRKMRLSWALFTIVVGGLFALLYYLNSTEGTMFHRGLSPAIALVDSSQAPAMLGGFWLMVFIACLFWAPRCAKLWTLTILNSLTALLMYALLMAVESVTLPTAVTRVVTTLEMQNGGRSTYSFSLLPLYNVALLTVACVLAWRVIRRRGEGWFRFE